METTDKWYQHEPETVVHNKDNNITIIWDMPIHRIPLKHRSERNGEEKQVQVPRQEIQRMWHMNTVAIPMGNKRDW
ncbi:hypothetical protein pdam_00016534 [Pocillopora damicornis]|uniref:Uncharacterized protein n=1 Tax=Pocillopora damicornis TaxID=46731 RepID=A0A3M6UHP3_POCDA|nr:hypothetical protein pdam_00016534 [Pocillopora damicornis]